MARKPKLTKKKNKPALNIKLSPREKQYFTGATEETVTFKCPVRGLVKQKVVVKKFRSPLDLPPPDPKYTVKMEDDMILDEEDFSKVDLAEMLDIEPEEIEVGD